MPKKTSFYLYFSTVALILLVGGTSQDTSNLFSYILPGLALVAVTAIFYTTVYSELLHIESLYNMAEPGYVESLARYRGTLNSSHGLPKGWVIWYRNSLDKHAYIETGIVGDDQLSFILHLDESGYLKVEGTTQNPIFAFYPNPALNANQKPEEKVKIKVFRDHQEIYNYNYPEKE